MTKGTRKSIGAFLLSALIFFFGNAYGKARALRWAIPADATQVLLKMASLEEGRTKGGWQLRGIEVRFSEAIVTYVNKEGKALRLLLVHPEGSSEAIARTRKFAIVGEHGKKVPKEVVEGLRRGVEENEDRFEWVKVVSRVAIPVDPLNRPKYRVEDQTWMKAIGDCEEDILRGDKESACNVAIRGQGIRDIGTVRALASIARRAGCPQVAVSLLEGSKGGEERAYSAAILTELLASEVLANPEKAYERAAKVTVSFPDYFESPDCALAMALDVLMQEGLALQAEKVLERQQGGSWCLLVAKLKAASALKDDNKVDERAREALSAFPDDDDITFLWGNYYYSKGAKGDAPLLAAKIWEPLVRRDPTYPTLLGQYGTACLVGGLLAPEATEALAKRAEQDRGDVVTNYLAGLGLYYMRRYREALQYLARAATALPNEPRIQMYYAMALFFNGEREEAGRILESLEPYVYQEPDIAYCRSLYYRGVNLPRAIRELERFLEIFEGEGRLRFGEHKVLKARSDLERMRHGEVPPLELPMPDKVLPEGPPGNGR